MSDTSSLDAVFGGSDAADSGTAGEGGVPPGAAGPGDGGTGVAGVPPAPIPQPPAPPVDPFAKDRAGFIAALTSERQARQIAERRLQQLGQHPGAQPAAPAQRAPAAPADAMPERADYANADDYTRDYAAWYADQAVAHRFKQFEQQQAQRAQAQQQETAEREFQARMLTAVSAGERAFPDFTPVVNSGLAPFLSLSPMMHEALIDLGDATHHVAYHLAKNPAEALRLAQISNQRALDRELAKLEVQVMTASSSTPPPLPGAPPAPPTLPKTLTQQRDARGQFAPAGAAYDGPTPLTEIFDRK